MLEQGAVNNMSLSFFKIILNQRRTIWVLLGLGLLLRLIAAWNSLYLVRADEVQYWEMAHRSVYGDGYISWEYKVGLRNWLNIWPNIIPLYFLKCIDVTHPDYYIPLVKSFYAILSMTIPFGMLKLAKELYDKKTAFVALVLGCFWYELILSSTHGITEFYSIYCTFGALMFLGESLGTIQVFVMGMLLGFGIAFRIHNFIPITIVGIFLLTRLNRTQIFMLLIGGLTSITAACYIDCITYGRFAGSYIIYISSIFSLNKLDFANNPYWQHFFNLFSCSAGLFVIVLGYGLLNLRKNLLPIAASLGILVFFSIQGIQEYCFISMSTPFLLCILASMIVNIGHRFIKIGLVLVFVAVSTAGYFGAFSPWYLFKENGQGYQRKQGAFYKDPWLATALELSNMPAGSVLWAMGDGVAVGGYYVFHHHNQIFFPSGVPAHAELIKGHDIHDFIRYVVAPNQPNGIPGFYFLKDLDGFCIYENEHTPQNQEIDGYAYEFQLPVEKSAIHLLIQKKLINAIPPLIFWR